MLNRPISRDRGTASYQASLPPPTPPSRAEGVRVSLLLPLSGANAKLGKAMLNAAQMALFAFADNRFELLVEDTLGTPQGAIDAVTLAVGDGASLVLGPLLSASVKAVSPAARAANVPVIAFSSDRSVVGDGIYTLGFMPSEQVERVAEFARSQKISRFAVLAPDNEYGATVVESLRRAVQSGGGVLSRVEFYDPEAKDFSGVVRRLADYDRRRQRLVLQRKELESKNDDIAKSALKRLERLQTIGDLPFDALLLADGGQRLQEIAALLPFYDIDPAKIHILGTGQWDEPGLGSEPALVGGWFAAPPMKARLEFEKRYQQIYGEKAPRLSTLAYDAVALAATLASKAVKDDGWNAVFRKQYLTSSSGYLGRDGLFRLLPDGTAERGLAVMQVEPRGSREIDPARQSFGRVNQNGS